MTTRPGWVWRLIPLALSLLILGFHVSTNFALATEQPSPNWSRAILLGETRYDGATLPALLDDGSALVVNTTREGLQYFRLSADGQLTGAGEVALGNRKFTGLTALGGKQVDLFWSSEPDGAGTISHATLSAEGAVAAGPSVVLEGTDRYVARQTAAGPAILVARADTLTLLRLTGGTFEPVWESPLPPVPIASMDAQVLNDGTLLAVLALQHAETDYELVLLRGSLQGGITETVQLQRLTLKRNPSEVMEMLGPVRLGVDATHGYAIYTRSAMRQGKRASTAYLVTGPLAGQWQSSPLQFAGSLTDKVWARELDFPSVVPGQADKLQVTFLADTSSRFEGTQGMVMGTFQSGQLQQIELLTHNRLALRATGVRTPGGTLVVFENPSGVSVRRIMAISSAPAVVQRMSQPSPKDLMGAVMNTIFDLTAMIYPIFDSGLWWMPIICLAGLLHMVALNWSERNPRTVFWITVILALPLIGYVGMTKFHGNNYTHLMPPWLAEPGVQAGAYLGAALLFLVLILRLKPPSRTAGAMVPLGYWAMGTLLTMSLLLGPFIRRG